MSNKIENLPKGIIRSKNHGGVLLERHTGIPFKEVPAAVHLNAWNNTVLYFNRRKFPELDIGLSFNPQIRLKSKGEPYWGIYFTSSNAFVFKKHEDPLLNIHISIHENAHALHDQINPNIHRQTLKCLIDYVKAINSGKQSPEEPLPEKALVLKFFTEGFSDWAAIEVAGREKGLRNGSLTQYHNDTMAEVIAGKISLIRGRDFSVEKEADLARDLLQRDNYLGGYVFTRRSLNFLRKQGMSLTETIIHLVKNPPHSWEDVHNPERYLAA